MMGIFSRVRRALLYRFRILKLFFLWKKSDYYILSFPKSGRTWLRLFVARYFSLLFDYPLDENFRYLIPPKREVPRIFFAHSGLRGEIYPKRRKGYMATDEMLEKNIKDLYGKPILFLVRDPRDVVVSHYFSAKKRGKSEQLRERMKHMELSEFIRDPEFGIEKIISYNNAWLKHKDSFRKFEIVRYEDMKHDPEEAFKNVLHFLGIESIDENIFREALSYSSFDNMKKIEKNAALGVIMRPGEAGDPESFKVRKGKIGGFREYLNRKDIEYVSCELAKLHPVFGYH
ncbi:MAG: sulfotransferase domain-containing protein [Candidatus Paceibacterota bacterium]